VVAVAIARPFARRLLAGSRARGRDHIVRCG
jgi:hypothetical protein